MTHQSVEEPVLTKSGLLGSQLQKVLGLRSMVETSPVTFTSSIEPALQYFTGNNRICVQLSVVVDDLEPNISDYRCQQLSKGSVHGASINKFG